MRDGDMFGPYRLVSMLGRGGMGEVWRAVDTRKDREIALKVLGDWFGGDEDFTRRFRREAALAARLSGPHIVPIHDYGDVDGRLFIDMALIVGPDLGVVIERDGPLPPARAIAVIAQAAKALDIAHRAGLVHRDVKPSNVLISDIGGEDFVYLIDFGIARASADDKLTLTGAAVGTPAYMAPERFDGDGDLRSDVYALGCVLYEALTGQRPFVSTSLLGFVKAHLDTPPPRPSARRGGLPIGLDAVITRSMAKDPRERFAAAGALAVAARDALGTAPAPATPTPAPRPTGPTSLRRTTGALAPAHARTPPPRKSHPRLIKERVLTGHTSWVLAATTVLLIDGRPVVITGSRDSSARVWDLAGGGLLGAPLTGHAGAVRAVAGAVLDGRPLAVTGGRDTTVRIWDLTSGVLVGSPLTGHTDAVEAVTTAHSHGVPVVISGGRDGTVRIWDLRTGRPVGTPLTGHTGTVSAVACAYAGGRPVIVTGGRDATVRVWDLAGGTPVGTPLTGHTEAVCAVAITQLGGRPVVISGAADRTVRVWDLITAHPVGTIAGHTDAVRAVATTELDGRPVLISGSRDATVRVWDLTNGMPVGTPLTGHTRTVFAVTAAKVDDRPVLITGSRDRTVRTWDLTARVGS